MKKLAFLFLAVIGITFAASGADLSLKPAKAGFPSSGRHVAAPLSSLTKTTAAPAVITTYNGNTSTFVLKYQPVATAGVSASAVQFNVQSSTTSITTINAITICTYTSGAAWNCDGTPTDVTIGGSTGPWTFTMGEVKTTDLISFAGFGSGKAVMIAFNMPTAQRTVRYTMTAANTTPSVAPASFVTYTHQGVQEATSSSRSAGYATVASTIFWIPQIFGQ